MANNHITDFDLSLEDQKEFYIENKIQAFGAGDDLDKASEPFINKEFVVLSFGWNVISCILARDNKRGVNPLDSKHIFNQVDFYKKKYPIKKIILVFHWNYEFELYPQPAHRKLAFDLIDYGVDAIFGHHSHIVQGAELYKGKPIFYGLGNFYFPNQNYNGFDIDFPKNSFTGLSVKYEEYKELKLIWTYKDKKNNLKVIKEEGLKESERIKELTPFSGLSHSEYLNWFRTNRVKNKLLPIFSKYNVSIENRIKEKFIELRQKAINFLVKFNLK